MPAKILLLQINNILKDIIGYEAYMKTTVLATHVRNNRRSYVRTILQLKSTKEAISLIKLFRRVLPDLLQQSDWSTILHLSRAVDRAAKNTGFLAEASGLPANWLESVFKNHVQKILNSYAKANFTQRNMIHDIAGRLDATGIEIMAEILTDFADGSGCEAALSCILNKGDLAKKWILAVLDDPGRKWSLKCTALMLLGNVAANEREIDCARKFAGHDDPRVREAALKVLIKLEAAGVEESVIAALSDPDDSVRRCARGCLNRPSSISENAIKILLSKISAGTPTRKNDIVPQCRRMVDLIKALGSVSEIVDPAEIESAILSLVRGLSYRSRWFLRRLNHAIEPAQAEVLSAAIATLGKIGTDKSESFLMELAAGDFPQAEPAQAAANHIRLRHIEMLSNAPVDNHMSAMA
jgi:HEAT repeat protein